MIIEFYLKYCQMKKIILFLVLCFVFSNVNAQYKKQYVYHDTKYGVCITSCGVLFSVIALSTNPEPIWVPNPTNVGSTYTNSSGHWTNKPLFQQGARSAGIITGFTLTITGLITMIVER